MLHRKHVDAKGNWVSYRPDIKILDCTIRDGGLVNDHKFDEAFVRAVFDTCIAAGVDYCELGYKAARRLFAAGEHGEWKFCDEDLVRRVVGSGPHPIKLSVMADVDRTDYHTDIAPKDKSVFDCVRVACYINQVPGALDLVKDAHDKGYETALNIMAISTVQDRELEDALAAAARSPVDTVYVVDSNGALYSEQVHDIVMGFLTMLDGTGKHVGIHAHNNMQLAYANTIEALIVGADRLDATIAGLGRGAGNCPLELLLAFLKNPKFRLRPVIKCIQEHFLPLRQTMDWGYSIPYMITGALNEHPRSAIAVRESGQPDEYLAFYDRMVEKV
ncbi:MAG: aldolase catalytic domain-containing protein [Polyangia bacterium]|jgi:4-hydroxy 2-oxovalerate aldolase